MSDGWLIFGDISAGVAAVAALLTVGVTIRFGKDSATQLGTVATQLRTVAEITERTRQGMERATLLNQYEAIGRLLERIFYASNEMTTVNYGSADWEMLRNELTVLMVGHAAALPLCLGVTHSNSRPDAVGKVNGARPEVKAAIEGLRG